MSTKIIFRLFLAALIIASQIPMSSAVMAAEPDGNKPVIYYRDGENEYYQPDENIEDYLERIGSTEYSPELGHMLLCISGAAYNSRRRDPIVNVEDNILDNPICQAVETDEDKKKTNIYRSLLSLGFEDISMYNYYTDPKDERYEEDTAAHTIAHKKLKNGRDLVLTAVRGSYGGIAIGSEASSDWRSNLNFSENESGNHTGFDTASKKVKQSLDSYVREKKLDDAVYVITGHSRGAAVANLLAKACVDEGKPMSDIYDYNFACPNVTVNYSDTGFYKNIFNVCNKKDLVAMVPPESWGWGKNGTTLWFTASSTYPEVSLLPEGAVVLLNVFGLSEDADLLTHAVPEYLKSTEGVDSVDDYIKALYPTAVYGQVGGDLFTDTGETLDGITLDSASLWKVSITPGSDPIRSINLQFTDTENETHIDESAVLDTPAITQGTIVVGAVINHPSTELSALTAIINDLGIKARAVE